MDDEERRSRSVEAGREMLEKYKAERFNRVHGANSNHGDQSDEDFSRDDIDVSSLDHQGSGMIEGMSSRDVTHSSISVSEGEGDGDLEGMAKRVAELEELLQNKEAMVASLHAQIDHLRLEASSPNSSQSHSSIQYRNELMTYKSKLQEFEKGVYKRDSLIEELTEALKQALESRDKVLERLNNLKDNLKDMEVANEASQQQISSLEAAMAKQEQTMKILNNELVQSRKKVEELELVKQTQATELDDYKLQVNQLNEQIRTGAFESNFDIQQTMEQQKQHEARVDRIKKEMQMLTEKCTEQAKIEKFRHQDELKELQSKYEKQLEEERKSLMGRLIREISELKMRHSVELSTLHAEFESCKKFRDDAEAQSRYLRAVHEKERQELQEQVTSYRAQIEVMTSKCVAATTVLDSKESIERSLEEAQAAAAFLRQENSTLNFKLTDLTERYKSAQSLIENNQVQERSLTSRIHDLEKSLSRLSGVSTLSELNETSYQFLDELALKNEITQKKLTEKAEFEKQLIDKVAQLEEELQRTRSALEEANMTKRSYEKQLKDMRNTCDKLRCDAFSAKEGTSEAPKFFRSSFYFGTDDESVKQNSRGNEVTEEVSFPRALTDLPQVDYIDALEKEIETLKGSLKQKEDEAKEQEKRIKELAERLQSSEEQRHMLQAGLAVALEQCSDAEERLSRTLENESRMEQSFAAEECKIKEIEARHIKEMDELRTYYEQKCKEIQKQFSDEVFSQQSKKMSEDSDGEDLPEDIYYGGAGDCRSTSPRHPSRTVTPVGFGSQKSMGDGSERTNQGNFELSQKLEDVKHDVERQAQEILEMKANYEAKIAEQKAYYESLILNMKERGNRVTLLKTVNQALLALNSNEEENTPQELIELRDKLTNHAMRQIRVLEQNHAKEVHQLKEELRKVSAELENQIHLRREAETHKTPSDIALIQERDNLYKTCSTLKGLVGELINYFAVCEEEVNNTLISEVLKTQLSKSEAIEESQQEETGLGSETLEMIESELQNRHQKPVESRIKRVHFAPQSSDLTSILNCEDNSMQNLIGEDRNITETLRMELDSCLRRLRSESAQVLGISLPPVETRQDSFSRQVLRTNRINEELTAKLKEAESMIMSYREDCEQLKLKILDLQQRLFIAESKKEIITEGYGEQEEVGGEVTLQTFSEVQDKARLLLSNGGGDNSQMFKLIEEFCRYSDKQMEDAKKEREDLQQQVSLDPIPTPYIHRVCRRKIEAADKQLRATRKFLEEQATEREAERDEAARRIESLQDVIKEREREKERDLRISSEQTSLSPLWSSDVAVVRSVDFRAAVEALECQLREMSSLRSDAEAKRCEMENELKAVMEKICDLKDIIAARDEQIQAKEEKEEFLMREIEQLREVIAAQSKNQQELVQELDAIKLDGENGQLNEHISHLQEELMKHKLSSEHFNVNSSALKQMKLEIREMQSQLDRRTKELEALHMCGSSLSLSQPSEDVSIRDQIDAVRCPTPDDPQAPPTLPLDQVLKLKEKLQKHARAEEVAFKRIKDLDMQLASLKNQNEELLAEQEILQQTTSEQLFQIESLRSRLEQQKQSAPFAQRQATSRLELQLHESNAKILAMEQVLTDKDLELKETRNQLDRVNKLLAEKEADIAKVVQTESVMIQKLKDRLEVLEDEKKFLESKVVVQERAHVELPQLIDTMLADKNEEIDHLKDQLLKRDKQLEAYLSLNLDDCQIRQAEPKSSARTLSDILSINSECEELPEAIRDVPNGTQITPQNISTFRSPHFVQLNDTPEVSPAFPADADKMDVQVPRLELGMQSQSPSICSPRELQDPTIPEIIIHSNAEVTSPGSAGEQTSSGSKVQWENASDGKTREHLLDDVEDRVDGNGQSGVEASDAEESKEGGSKKVLEDSGRTKESLMETVTRMEGQLARITEELHLKSADLEKRERELDLVRNTLDELRVELRTQVETLTREKCFYKNQYELSQASEAKITMDLMEVENTLKMRDEELEEYRRKMQMNERILTETREREQKQIKVFEATVQEKSQEIKNLREIIFEKDITIETMKTRNLEIENENKQLYEQKTKFEQYGKKFAEYQGEIQRLTEGLNNRDQVIGRLEEMARRSSFSGASSPSENKDQEIHHLQEYLKEKDKVIRQMSDDSKSLHRALETIQNKMKESGNVVELRRKLKEEKKLNAELKEVVQKLRKELEGLGNEPCRQSEEGTEIEEMVQRELNLSARLDKRIMEAIESEPEDGSARLVEIHHGNTVNGRSPNQEQQENVIQRYSETRIRLKQALKVNEELNKLKDDLEIEKEMLRSQVVEYEDRILQIKSFLDEECKKVTHLDEELSSEKNVVRNLRIQIQREQNATHVSQAQNSELIAHLRRKLEDSLNVEDKLRKDLATMRQEQKSLEAQLSSVREHVQSQQVEDVPKLSELLRSEQKKYVALVEEVEKEQRKSSELELTLKRTVAEKNRCEQRLEVALEEKEKFISSLVLAEGIKEHLETDLKRTKEELKSREDECEWLQKRIETMTNAETKRQQQRSNEHNELKSLRREVANCRDVMCDLEADMKQSKKELAKAVEQKTQLARCVELLTEKESELNRKLEAARNEEKRLKEVISDMQNDLRANIEKELQLNNELQRERLCSENNAPVKFVQKIKELNEIVERLSGEKNALREKLMKAREEREQFATRTRTLESETAQRNKGPRGRSDVPPGVFENVQHFYGKHLRAESRRKALKFQKRYLICVLGGYEISEELTLCTLAQLTHTQRACTIVNGNRKNPRLRFRKAVLVLVSIRRMKWLVLRWRTGYRIGANAVLGNAEQFVPLRRHAPNHSPPVRDTVTSRNDLGNALSSQPPSLSPGQGNLDLGQYRQRFLHIERTLNMAMADAGSRQLPE
ncbi:golgin subfamily A member 4 isoform X1 [Orussus abietinus]|uniref:golgin subfamily A member 4 isoform X1 n=1 Tax=Orussus abietinus TaxID=222816 RepID=UPI00062563C2|nr:golgin subfamily A member 4 isoform X1 [Orussus abietinus]